MVYISRKKRLKRWYICTTKDEKTLKISFRRSKTDKFLRDILNEIILFKYLSGTYLFYIELGRIYKVDGFFQDFENYLTRINRTFHEASEEVYKFWESRDIIK